MMVMLTDIGLFAMGLLMLFGQIILVMMFQAGWFKKENFKIQAANVKAENKLNIRAMEKRLGLTKAPSSRLFEHEPSSLLSTIGSVLPMIKDMDKEKLAALVDIFVDRGYASEEEVEKSPVDWVLNFAEKNPDVAKGFVNGLLNKTEGATEQTSRVGY